MLHINDKFIYVRNIARRLHRSKTTMLLFKLDIKKAFDSLRWDYLMDLLQHLGFPARFRGWVSALVTLATSRVLLNGTVGDPIRHGKGLRQGDPMSPLLFVLAIDPLHHILNKATTQGKLHPIRRNTATHHASLYADDAAGFVKPMKEDVSCFASILGGFGEVTGLVTNCSKSLVAPIRCAGLDLPEILQLFPAKLTSFLMTYLGLPLSVKRLKAVHFLPLEDKVARRLAPWIGHLMAAPRRAIMVKAVLTAIAIYSITSLILLVR